MAKAKAKAKAKVPYGPKEKVYVQVWVEFMFFMKPDLDCKV